MLRYMIPKGSVAIDGISLTINTCSDKGFEISIIPHTAKLTSIGFKKTGDNVNIETDMIGKYVEHFGFEVIECKNTSARCPQLKRILATGVSDPGSIFKGIPLRDIYCKTIKPGG